MLDMAALRLADLPRLENLPTHILLIIFSYLDTAQSVARLALTCKSLHRVVRANGWRFFVGSHFETLNLPQGQIRVADDEWMYLAQSLTWQSQAWDRRAFSLAALVTPVKAQHHGGRSRMQTFPPHIIVDARLNLKGNIEEETVAWGAGEDVVVRRRELRRSSPRKETWTAIEGAATGFNSGKDDVTAISILNDTPALLVGRACGHLQLLSTGRNDFGRAITRFQPPSSDSLEQKDIRHFDTNTSQNTAAVITKDSLFLYPLMDPDQDRNTSEVIVQPTEALDVRNMQDSRPFRFLRAVRFMRNGDLALGMTSNAEPMRYLTRTPSGTVLINAAKLQSSRRCTESYIYDSGHLQTVRGLLPVNTASVAGASGTVLLSSHDDGTIRLQDLRSPSAVDTIYQDHFELMTPVGPLISHGMERFIVGSARTSTLKIFDFRWTKSYYYTNALPCSKIPLGPTPKPPTFLSAPQFPERGICSYLSGLSCNLHALARTDFYRPNCNVYLPIIRQAESPVYSLAKSSDMSPIIFGGLAGVLVKMSLRDQVADLRESSYMQRTGEKNRCGYSYHENPTSIVETGDGIALSDITKSQRVPNILRQNRKLSPVVTTQQLHRLDELLM